MGTAPWDIYAEQLTHLGYGHPLWVPDPAPGQPPVEVGDVGWINDGEFLPLFNVFRGEHDAQFWGAVPVDFVPLGIRECALIGPRDKISQSVLCSQSIQRVDVSGEYRSASSNMSCGVNFTFECMDEAGALLVMGPSGRTTDILSRQRIVDYMNTHFDSWLEFANDRLGLGLKEDQIMFVSGTTKTSRWGVAAFRGTRSEKRGTVVGNFGPLATVDFSFSISDAQLSHSHYRSGPTEGRGCQDKYDQCVFIHYYKRKRRKWSILPSVMKAAAGPVRTRAVRRADGVGRRSGEIRWGTARGVRTSAKLLATP
ncbi:hypothetical protein C8Q77DRAFT_1058568 [Trametes polyzona]|nr:hypothetical protein C8Q77DRAFT_1058568 [Trametes polyzona]